MWKCPDCGREFENNNQKHSCGEAPKTIDAYINAQPEEIRPVLRQVREVISRALPDAVERISWKMPTYWKKHNIIHFAGFKNHFSIFPGDKAIEHFLPKLKSYGTSKGAVRFSYNEPPNLDLIAEIAKWCYETGNHH